jgi:hypothetical protein
MEKPAQLGLAQHRASAASGVRPLNAVTLWLQLVSNDPIVCTQSAAEQSLVGV